MRKCLLFILFLVFFCYQCKTDDIEDLDTVKYRIKFSFYWNNQDFPNDYPSNAYFSKLIGDELGSGTGDIIVIPPLGNGSTVSPAIAIVEFTKK